MKSSEFKNDFKENVHRRGGFYYVDVSDWHHNCWHYSHSTWKLCREAYAKRGQTNPCKIRRQLFESKGAEVACYYFSWYLIFKFSAQKSMVCSLPDFRALPCHEKSWDPDTRLIPIIKRRQKRGMRYLCVKQQNESEFKPSWMCEKIDEWIRSGKSNSFAVLCTLTKSGVYRIDYATCLANLTKEVFDKPIVKQLRKTKIALYSELMEEEIHEDCHFDLRKVFE